MRILSITAQKPDSTGSGVFLTELVRGFARLGCSQAVVCGTVPEDTIDLPGGAALFPVYYHTPGLPFPVCGMSDEMPYESTRYRDLTGRMSRQLMGAFRQKIEEAVQTFRPDVILCHHLYFLAALVRQMYPDIPVWGQCHGSDLRQLSTNDWQGDWIRSGIRNLDGIFALHEVQKRHICDTFGIPEHRVYVMGTGYNSEVFHLQQIPRDPEMLRLIFAGKLSEKKGVFSLLRALDHLSRPQSVELRLAGGSGNTAELEKLRALAEKAPCTVTFLGRLDQQTLARHMNECDVFILPSFYEGLPLVLIEAMACGDRVICTDLPGIRPWLDRTIPGSGALFVDPPRLRNGDEPYSEDLPGFERRLARAIEDAASRPLPDPELVRQVSWDALCQNIIHHWTK